MVLTAVSPVPATVPGTQETVTVSACLGRTTLGSNSSSTVNQICDLGVGPLNSMPQFLHS